MKKLIALSLMTVGFAFAQSGLAGGSDGLHQHNAKTLGQWNVHFGTGGDIASDNWALARGGYFDDENGRQYFHESVASLSGNINMAVGLADFIDLGVSMPLYYDHANDDSGDAAEYNMWKASRGDLETWLKVRLPIDSNAVFNMAALYTFYFPTGEQGAGVRPRHAWYLGEGPNKATHPYTSDKWAMSGIWAMTLDLTKVGVPVRWNVHGGYVYVLEGGTDAVVYGTGLNIIPSKYVDIFAEFSGEMRVQKTAYPRDPMVDPMLLTPGLRFHLPYNIDLAMGLDVAVRWFKNPGFDYDKEMEKCGEFTLYYVDEKGRKATYCYASTPIFAPTASLSWHFDAKTDKDEDGDGVVDEKDQCAHTPQGAKIDENGCPIDSDKDGVFDGLDQCTNTPEGAPVDSLGCPLDSDKDGVFDYMDKCPNSTPGGSVNLEGCESDFDKDGIPDVIDRCPNTQSGIAVDSTGCPADADKDGVLDAFDKCPNTPAGLPVDLTGCPADADKDGIADAVDKCPNTPAGLPVDSTGCPADGDKDGVPDAMDKCPNTKAGASVNYEGCEGDFDGDGVPDAMDKCPNTKKGYPVDSTGCPVDADKDGIPDALDKCPNTAAGTSVDSTGCPMDFDKDGIPDDHDRCPNTPKGLVVDSLGCPADGDKDGVPDGVDKCPTTEKGISVDSVGCPLDTDHDGVADHLDKCPYTLTGVKIDSKGCPTNKKEDLNKLKQGIQFQPNSVKFTKNSYGTLKDIAALMKKIPEAKLEVQGHTDNVGKESKNKELSQKRAQAVVDYLVDKGNVNPTRLRAVGYGSEKPIASNGSKKGRKQNRRVELVPFE
ncbi:MAG: OmpA family protein [Fibrobacteraceae bacterium]|nr:OmpA family protein [Fibrobacteraceae bacterium]